MFLFSFQRLTNRAIGFSPERIVVFDIVNPANQPSVVWDQVADRLRNMPGVESVAYADWPLLDGRSFKANAISVQGQPSSNVAVSFLNISPGWLNAMKIPFVAGRDFHRTDLSPGAAIVNETFVARFLPDGSPLGKWFEGTSGWMRGQRFQIVGVVRDALYRDVRRAAPPLAYAPFRRTDTKGTMQGGTLVVRTLAVDPLQVAAALRAEIPRIRGEFRVSNVRTQQAVIDEQAIRERMLAILARFFGLAALILASIGLYGVLSHSVLLRRREIGICRALGAQPGNVAVRVTGRTFLMVFFGALAGLAMSTFAGVFVEPLLYQVKASDPPVIMVALLALAGTAALAAWPAIMRALEIDPIDLLRADASR